MPSVWFWETTLFLLGISHRVLKMWKQFKGGVGLYFSRSDSSDQGEVLVKLADFRSFARRDDRVRWWVFLRGAHVLVREAGTYFTYKTKWKKKDTLFAGGFFFLLFRFLCDFLYFSNSLHCVYETYEQRVTVPDPNNARTMWSLSGVCHWKLRWRVLASFLLKTRTGYQMKVILVFWYGFFFCLLLCFIIMASFPSGQSGMNIDPLGGGKNQPCLSLVIVDFGRKEWTWAQLGGLYFWRRSPLLGYPAILLTSDFFETSCKELRGSVCQSLSWVSCRQVHQPIKL